MSRVLVEAAISFGASTAGSLVAWACLFHFDVEGRWEAWRLRRGKSMTSRQRRSAEEFMHDPRHRW